MSFRSKIRNPNFLMIVGFTAMALANLARVYFRSHATSSDLLPDFVFGLFYGIGIPTLLRSVWLLARPNKSA